MAGCGSCNKNDGMAGVTGQNLNETIGVYACTDAGRNCYGETETKVDFVKKTKGLIKRLKNPKEAVSQSQVKSMCNYRVKMRYNKSAAAIESWMFITYRGKKLNVCSAPWFDDGPNPKFMYVDVRGE